MRRSLLTILIVAAIAGWISASERAVGRPAGDWVRTNDGWESRVVLQPREESPAPTIHPGVLAALQLGVSVLFLLAFPSRVRELAVSRATAYFTERRHGGDRRQRADRRQALELVTAG
jgi:hypothetical protein